MSIEAFNIKQSVADIVDTVATMPRQLVLAHVNQSRRAHPEAMPTELCRILERRYLAAVTSSGGAVGTSAALPGVGTPVALALAGGEVITFVSASALLAVSIAEVHGIGFEDLERRRTLIMAVMLGDSGAATVTKIAERTGAHWGKRVARSVPIETIRRINRVLGRNFVTKYGTKQGILVLGKAAPFGIGAVIGAGGNLGLGYATVKAARRAFGEPPARWGW